MRDRRKGDPQIQGQGVVFEISDYDGGDIRKGELEKQKEKS